MSFGDRQTGRTTRQMQGAPRGSVFVWVNHHLGYPRALARRLGREDLEIVSPSWLVQGFVDRQLPGLVVDHAAELTNSQFDGWSYARQFRVARPDTGADA